jgi:hypothetical protein
VYQDLVVLRNGFGHLFESKDVRWAVFGPHNCFDSDLLRFCDCRVAKASGPHYRTAEYWGMPAGADSAEAQCEHS